MTELRELLTNEKLIKRFGSQFQLVNYAMALAANMLRTGRAPRAKSDVQNPVHYVLNEILNDVDRFDEEPAAVETPKEHEVEPRRFHPQSENLSHK